MALTYKESSMTRDAKNPWLEPRVLETWYWVDSPPYVTALGAESPLGLTRFL